jgi:uncharacterized protein YceK
MKLQAFVVLTVVTLVLAACGSPVTLTPGSPTAPISSAGTYTFTLSGTNGCLGAGFYLTSDTGSVDNLTNQASGSLYLTAGNWMGESGFKNSAGTFVGDVCDWTLTLTPQ